MEAVPIRVWRCAAYNGVYCHFLPGGCATATVKNVVGNRLKQLIKNIGIVERFKNTEVNVETLTPFYGIAYAGLRGAFTRTYGHISAGLRGFSAGLRRLNAWRLTGRRRVFYLDLREKSRLKVLLGATGGAPFTRTYGMGHRDLIDLRGQSNSSRPWHTFWGDGTLSS